MAVTVLRDVSVTVNSVDLSDHVRSVTITEEAPEVDVTAMGAAAQQFLLGIPDATIEVEFLQDFASAEVHATLQPLAGENSPFPVVVLPTSDAVGASNPSATMQAVLPNYSGIAGSIGDASTTTATFRNSDPSGIVWATA